MAASIVLPATSLTLRRVHARIHGGLVASGLHLLFMAIYGSLAHGESPLRVLQGISASVFGEASYAGSGATAVIGACLHLCAALAAAAVYVRACNRLPLLRTAPLHCGALYGALLFALASVALELLPATAPMLEHPGWTLANLLACVTLVGMPIAWFARRT